MQNPRSAIAKDTDDNSADSPRERRWRYTETVRFVRRDAGKDNSEENRELANVRANGLTEPVGVEYVNHAIPISDGKAHYRLL
jgi:hypothetical protein